MRTILETVAKEELPKVINRSDYDFTEQIKDDIVILRKIDRVKNFQCEMKEKLK